MSGVGKGVSDQIQMGKEGEANPHTYVYKKDGYRQQNVRQR